MTDGGEGRVPSPEAAKAYFQAKVEFTTGPGEVAAMRRQGKDLVLVDVRAARDFAKGHVPGAVSLPRERWETDAGLAKDKLNVLYCYSQACHLAAKAAVALAGRGYPVMEMEGGFDAWRAHALPIEGGDDAEPAAARADSGEADDRGGFDHADGWRPRQGETPTAPTADSGQFSPPY